MSNYSLKVAITGGCGQLACALREHTLAHSLEIKAFSRSEVDITDCTSIATVLLEYAPDVIVNTAAYTAVDQAEIEPLKSLQINYHGTRNLALACQKQAIPLIHLSTDYVFDGTKETPYGENDSVNPLNHYGKSKWLSEQAVREHCTQHIILRVSGVFSEFGNNFLKTILRLAQEKKQLKIVADQITCPTYAGDIAGTILSLIKQQAIACTPWGTYHFCSDQPVSWYQFAVAIIEEARKIHSLPIETIKAISAAEYQTAAKRPAYSVLDCQRIKQDFGIIQPDWENGLKIAIKKLLDMP